LPDLFRSVPREAQASPYEGRSTDIWYLASWDWIDPHIPEGERPPVGYQVALPENSEMW
jgi:hypothetical protein